MKLYRYLTAFSLLALCAGCTEDVKYETGDLDNPDNYGVYFPHQIPSTNIELDVGTKTQVTYKAMRTNTADAIRVPVVVKSSVETSDPENPWKPVDGIFIVEPIVFAEGEKETSFTVYFPETEIGKQYDCSITIEDPKYISLYGTNDTGLTFTVLRAGWKLLGKGKWRDDVVSSLYGGIPYPNAELDVDVYEREDLPGYYRMEVFTPDFLDALFGQRVRTEGVRTVINATDPEKVWIPVQSTGITVNTSDGYITIASYVDRQFSIDASDSQYGRMERGVITFPVKGIMANLSLAMGKDEWATVNMSGMQRIMLPDARPTDYTLLLESTGTQPGEGYGVRFTLGSDVVKVRYALFEGRLDEGQVSLSAQDIESAKDYKELDESATLQIVPEKTGIYTLIGCTYDAEGQMRDFSSLNFGYVAPGDSRPVVLTIGLEGTNEQAGLGNTTDNAVKFYAYGEGIESLEYALCRKDKVGEREAEVILDAEGVPFTETELEQLNAGYFRTMFTGLNGDRTYVLYVRAHNGYGKEIRQVEYTTTGTFNPLLDTWNYSDFFTNTQPDREKLTNTRWNYYAINLMDEGSSLRMRKIGEATIEDVTGESYQSQVDELRIKGLTGLEMSEGGSLPAAYIKNSSLFNGYWGAFALNAPAGSNNRPLSIGKYLDEDIYASFIAEEQPTYMYSGYGFFAGAVADGYIALVPNPVGIEQQLTFSFLYFGSESAVRALYMNMMLVDPDKDQGLTASPAIAMRNAKLLQRAVKEASRPLNYVEVFNFGAFGERVDAYYRKFASESGLLYATAPAGPPSAKSTEFRVSALPASEWGETPDAAVLRIPGTRRAALKQSN